MTKQFFTEADCELKQGNKYDYTIMNSDHFISLARANELIEKRGKVVYSHNMDGHPTMSQWYFDSVVDASQGATHRALLISIEPPEVDTPEKCLKDLIALMNGPEPLGPRSQAIYNRARKLISKGEVE